jgi:hypothetical protein
MTDDMVAQLMALTFELSLPQCELRQCGASEPRVYSGPGFVRQAANGTLIFRMFASEHAGQGERLTRLFGDDHTPGVLIPTTSFFDLIAIDQNGDTWKAYQLHIEETFGISTEIRADFSQLEKSSNLSFPVTASTQIWFIPEAFELPWHVQTKSEKGIRTDRFEFEDNEFAWTVHKADNGRVVRLTTKKTEMESHSRRFLHALGMLSGHILEPLISQLFEHSGHTTHIDCSPSRKPVRVPGPLTSSLHMHRDAHVFLLCCLRKANQPYPGPAVDQLLVLYRFWYRIAKARSNDIENSSLVLSVAIEGVIKELFHGEQDTDSAFVDALLASKPSIEALEINQRVRDSMLKSLENSAFPKPKDTMQRLKEQGALHQDHIKAWKALRNTGAHGALLQDENGEFQKHLNRYFCCLDLFYRLVFVSLGYRGRFVDRSVSGWPDSDFPAAQASETAAN